MARHGQILRNNYSFPYKHEKLRLPKIMFKIKKKFTHKEK